MPYADDTIQGISIKLARLLTKNPSFIALFGLLYVGMTGAFFFYEQQKKEAAELRNRTEQLQKEIIFASAERNLFLEQRSKNTDVQIFRRLSFNEKSDPRDQEKLQAALSLNSFARYALQTSDLRKARETLDESMTTFPTLEAQYYLGVVDYLEGHTENAIGAWTKVSKSSGPPDDLLMYLSLAEYRSGNFEAAKRFADQYSRTR